MAGQDILITQGVIITVAGIINLSLGVYVLSKNPKRIVNKAFAALMCFAAIWSIELVLPTPEQKILVSYLSWTGIIFLCPTLFLLTLMFPKKRKIAESKLIYAFYLPPLFTYISVLTTNIHHLFIADRFLVDGVLKNVYGPLFWVHTAISYFYIMAAILMGASFYRRTREPMEKKQCLLFLVAVISPFLMNILYVPLRRPFLVDPTPVFLVITGIALTTAVVKYSMFVSPASEEILRTTPKYTLKPGSIYLTVEEKPAHAYEIFMDQITHGRQGMCLSKIEVEKVKKMYGLKRTPIIQLGLDAAGKILSLKNPERVRSTVKDFVRKAKRPIVLVDCVGEMKMVNGFESIRKFLKKIKVDISKTESNLLLSLNPYLFTDEQLGSICKMENLVQDIFKR